MRFLNRSENSTNSLVGIFLLILLAVFIGPNMLPRFVSSVAPGLDESIPCAWLREGQERAYHQSLIGRAAANPLSLSVRTSAVPNTADGVLSISITVSNNSLGTIPILYNSNQVIVGDNGTSGLGIIFTPPASINLGTGRQDSTSYPEENIRILGPRQRCVHRIDIPVSQLDQSILSGASQVRAYYRINSAGQSVPNPAATAIYPDQGLDTVPNGYIESSSVPISLSAQ
ncbi:MAG: hypothetical protein K8L99_08715 [Anaerolineae bacterium]|nr:hypothetical protein [Anaerolineae bacterium]